MSKNKNDATISALDSTDFQRQKNEWRKKSWSIPDLRGKKQEWFSAVTQLVELISNNQANDMDAIPHMDNISDPPTWRAYAPFLKGMGLATNQAGALYLSPDGAAFQKEPTKVHLANLIQDKTRLFGEVLVLLNSSASTVEEINKLLCEQYGLTWKNLSNTRRRMDWLEVLGLIQGVGNRKWEVTADGKEILKGWCIVSPEVLKSLDSNMKKIVIPEPPQEIASILQQLVESPDLHKKRSTYNIWAPSPNRIENLRVITQFATERVSKADYYHFIEDEFHLKASSVESMFPFLKAAELIEEVGRNIYLATPIAKAWLETGSDFDFVRILHANMQFVGEMIRFAEDDIVRNDVYTQAKKYGLNTEKARWIAGFLIEAGLLEEPQYLHLKATPTGCAFAATLPLADPLEELSSTEVNNEETVPISSPASEIDRIIDRLHTASRDPGAEGRQSGLAFEEAIAEIFRLMGFDAKRIGGSGDTDVVVRWRDQDRKSITAIVDGKSKSSGQVSHSDISDVAIDTHKDKNNAEYVAIVGPAFSGDTIRNHAKKKSFALITATELGDIARVSQTLGLSLDEIALIFQVPNGLSLLDELMSSKQRELDIISTVTAKFRKEQELIGGLSPRDLFLLLRDTNVSPSLEELLNVFETLSKPEIGVLTATNSTSSPENTIYILHNEKKAVNRLHALANAVDRGLTE